MKVEQEGPAKKQRYVSKRREDDPGWKEEEPPYYFLFTTYLSYLVLICFGHLRDFFGKRFLSKNYKHLKEQNGYAPLNSDFDNFYVRRLKLRINDCFNRPVTGVPGRKITLLERETKDYCKTFQLTGTKRDCLNLSSYNYLGFAQSQGPCADAVEQTVRKYGISTCSPRNEVGTSNLHLQVESLVAKFVGKPAAMLISMGYATNSTTIPALASKGCLIISDELNHSSIVFGSRLAGAFIRVFKHNNMTDLESLLKECISQGQPRTHRPWKKILLIVEGLYSMEGSICNLPKIIELKKKYKFYLYVDEAHSIGALGPHGRGVCDYYGIDPNEVDILMGTLTKSFGAAGGYIAADKNIINHLRLTNHATIYAESMTPIVLQQIYTSMSIIMGEDGTNEGQERLERLAFNSRYLSTNLRRLGFIVYGDRDSPIIPLLLFNPAKIPAFSRECLKRNLAVVVVAYPATPMISSRARFCISAAHTKEDIDEILKICNEIGDILQLKLSSNKIRYTIEEVLRDGENNL
ncbi:PLP-dependent transferase [Rhizophagus irregularis]|nr:PLP-dependent transferase [Rhizophagus irregularis]PKK74422.1 PLP-dependent transferase [Rhizophagus irregularis]PKY18183.1 PLP-dependent transferase [Rhizophagus irregularis]